MMAVSTTLKQQALRDHRSASVGLLTKLPTFHSIFLESSMNKLIAALIASMFAVGAFAAEAAAPAAEATAASAASKPAKKAKHHAKKAKKAASAASAAASN